MKPPAVRSPLLLAALALRILLAPALSAALPPTELPGLRYTNAFFPGVTYQTAIPTPESVLGFPTAERAASSTEIERCLRAWTNAAPDRTRLVEYARSHENRPLHYLVLASPANLARLDEIQSDLARLADPRTLSPADATQLIERLPGVAWLSHTIHGDETEGSDAALVLIHHLLAAQDPAVTRLLENLVIIVDPLMNPDGRDRFLKMIDEHRGTTPNLDDQSLLHSGYWPWGRGNHYLFDLNRDLLFAEQPETRGRIREIARWNPIVLVDAHGMGAHDTHLFSPPREPINPNIPKHRRVWAEVFGAHQAAAFDRRGLVYYSGEWNDDWYPGYTDAWACYRGAVGILYEQARIASDGIRRAEGRILSYRESVLHHVVGALANLETASSNAHPLLAGFHATRREAVDPVGPYANRTFALPPSANASRWRDFAELLQRQGFEVYTNATEILAPNATNTLGEAVKDLRLPPGTLLVPNRQPLAHLLAAFLDFDPRMPPASVEEERRELLRRGTSRIYDITAWNLPMFYALPTYQLPTDLPADAHPYVVASLTPPATNAAANPVAWVFDGAEDRSLAAAARLLERGVQLRVADKPFVFDQHAFERGSIVITRLDNRTFPGDLTAILTLTAQELGIPAHAVTSGLGPGELPDLGGGHFNRLEPLRVATLGRDGANATDYGSVWFTLDQRLGIRHSQLDGGRGADFARYNVIIVPERSGADTQAIAGPLKDWVQAGGTLVVLGSSVSPFIAEKADFSHVRALPDVLGRLPEYELAVLREWQGRSGAIPDLTNVWSHLPPARLDYPWQVVDGAHPDEKEMKRRDAWQSLFMPEGSFLATRIDTNHWLTAGCPEPLPVLAGRNPILMAADGTEAPIRFGLLTPVPAPAQTNAITPDRPGNRDLDSAKPAQDSKESKDARTAKEAKDSKENKDKDKEKDKDGKGAEKPKEPPRIGWCASPADTRLQLRMSGLLWPEATHRFANSAWVTRESMGRGQVILFASTPTFRAGARGTTRVFLNAVVLGPGLGAQTPIRP